MNKTDMEIQQKNIKQALELIKQNPTLPIIPLVNFEIVADDSFRYWAGSWGEAAVNSYAVYDGMTYYLSDDKHDLYECIFGELPAGLSGMKEDEYIEKMIGELEWIKAIFIGIELPN